MKKAKVAIEAAMPLSRISGIPAKRPRTAASTTPATSPPRGEIWMPRSSSGRPGRITPFIVTGIVTQAEA